MAQLWRQLENLKKVLRIIKISIGNTIWSEKLVSFVIYWKTWNNNGVRDAISPLDFFFMSTSLSGLLICFLFMWVVEIITSQKRLSLQNSSEMTTKENFSFQIVWYILYRFWENTLFRRLDFKKLNLIFWLIVFGV